MAKPIKKRTKSQAIISSVSLDNQQKIHQRQLPVNSTTFRFISNNYSVYLQCPICKLLMIKPMRTHPCGHTFCQKCIEAFTQIKVNVCPYDKCLRKFQLVQNDRTAESLIDELKVECTNDGCVWKGEYDMYKRTHKDFCVFRNGGLDNWLTNLTEGIVMTQINNSHNKQSEQNQDFRKPLQKSQTFQQRIEESFCEDSQKEYQQSLADPLVNFQEQKKQRQPISTQDELEKQEKQVIFNFQDRIRINANHKQTWSANSNIQTSNHQEEKRQKQQKVKVGESVFHQLSSNQSRSRGEFSIFHLPFGPGLEEQINSRADNKNKYIKKQLKKLQG